jgi:thioredoxin 1
MGKYVELTDNDFDATTAKGLTLVDFWAPWCGPCRMVAPTIEKLADEFEGKVQVAKLNVDDNQMSAMKFRVMSIPTVILFKDGQPAEMYVGADVSGNKYRQMIAKHLPQVQAVAQN